MTKYRLLHVGPAPLEGVELEHVPTAAAARALFAQRSPIDALVVEEVMSDGDGVLFIEELRAAGHELAILAITRADNPRAAERALDAGATDFLPRTPGFTEMLGVRLRAAIERQRAEQRYHALFEHSPISLWEEDGSEMKAELDRLRASGVTDIRAYLREHPEMAGRLMSMVKVLDVNQASLRQYEARDKAELIDGLAATLTPTSFEMVADQIVKLFEGDTVFEAETIDQSLRGRRNHTLLKTIVAPGSESTFSKVYVAMVDITARRVAEEQARMLAQFPELNPTSVLRLAHDGSIAYANPAARELAHAYGNTLERLLPENTAQIVAAILKNPSDRPVIETRHGSRTIVWTFLPVQPLHAVHCYGVDVTERLQLEEQLRHSQKMDAIGHLAGGIAHDFNNLLTVIFANTAMLQRQRPSPSLDSIAKASERAAALVRQLLAFSRHAVIDTRPLELNRSITELMKLLERVVREDVEIRLVLDPSPVWARADAGMIDQVLTNLVVNARDAMPTGGSVVLSTARVTITADDRAAYPELLPGEYACVRVADTGMGIAPDNLGRIFDPFFTTKELGKGTGLGLSTAFGIVKQHGGVLAVASEPGRGAVFTMLLPLAPASRHSADPASVALHGGMETILVVEDEEPVRSLVREVLETHGYHVLVVSTGAAAIAAAHGGSVDLVLTDMIMPGGLSGRELAERLRISAPALEVIFMSGYTGDATDGSIELVAGTNFLQKPFLPAQLLACVRARLDRKRSR